jgi:hypothetical protein
MLSGAGNIYFWYPVLVDVDLNVLAEPYEIMLSREGGQTEKQNHPG